MGGLDLDGLRLDPDHPELGSSLKSLANVYELKGGFKSSNHHFQRALDLYLATVAEPTPMPRESSASGL